MTDPLESSRYYFNRQVGELGETAVLEILTGLGFCVCYTHPADLDVAGVAVEVKTASLCPYRTGHRLGFQFCLRRDGHCRIRAAFVILVCTPDDGYHYFVIPAHVLGQRRKVTIPNSDPAAYRGQWAEYYNRWDLLAAAISSKGGD